MRFYQKILNCGFIDTPENEIRNNENFPESPIDKSEESATIKSGQSSTDGGPGSGNFGHNGVPGQIGGSAPAGTSGVTNFKRSGGKMPITSDVKVKTNQTPVTLKSGTIITKIVDFAGTGKKRQIDVEPFLIKKYGGMKGGWTHTRGEADVVLKDGSTKKAELHWFECSSVGQVSMKVKRYI